MATAIAADRDELRRIQAAAAAKRDEVKALDDARADAREKFTAKALDPVEASDSPEFKAAKDAMAAYTVAADELRKIEAVERGMLEMLGASIETYEAARPEPACGVSNTLTTSGLAASDEFRHLASYSSSKAKFGSINLFSAGEGPEACEDTARMLATGGDSRYLAATVDSADKTGAMTPDRRGIVVPALRKLRLLDLFVIGTTEANTVDYVQITTLPGQAAETAEGGAKPEASFVTADVSAPAATIAEWVKLTRQSLSDAGTLMAAITGLLTFDVRKRLESQMIAGNGTAPNMRGLLNTAGIGAPAFVAGDDKAACILRALTAVYLSDGDPNFVALHPTVMQDLRLMKASTAGVYLYGDPASADPPTIWGIPVVQSAAVPATTALVGDSMGATPLVREGVTARVSDSDTDDFTKNRVTLLVETRVAFPVWRPSAFAKAVFA